MSNLFLIVLSLSVYLLFAGAALTVFTAGDGPSAWTKKATILVGSAAAAVIVWSIYQSEPIGPAGLLVSSALLIFSALLFLASIAEQKRQLKQSGKAAALQYAGSNESPPQLTVTGPYRWVRHPIYSAYVLGWIGGAIASMAPLAIGMAALMFFLYIVSAKAEERAIMQSDFGADYRSYQQSTKMFVPLVY